MRMLAAIGLLVTIYACSSSPVPRSLLPPDDMQKVVYDLVQVDEFVNNFVTKDSTVDVKQKRSVLYEQVFKMNNTNRKVFYASYKYYQQHPDIQKLLFDSLYENLNRKKLDTSRPKPVPAVK